MNGRRWWWRWWRINGRRWWRGWRINGRCGRGRRGWRISSRRWRRWLLPRLWWWWWRWWWCCTNRLAWNTINHTSTRASCRTIFVYMVTSMVLFVFAFHFLLFWWSCLCHHHCEEEKQTHSQACYRLSHLMMKWRNIVQMTVNIDSLYSSFYIDFERWIG